MGITDDYSTDERHIVANQRRLPSGTLIRSFSRHDYVSVVEEGKTYMVDGGIDYLRGAGGGEHCHVFDDDPFETVREHLVWGTYGPDGKQPFRWIPLCEMEDDHIIAVMEECRIAPWREVLMKKELELRNDGEITRKFLRAQVNIQPPEDK